MTAGSSRLLSAGKLRGLTALANERGVFNMVAVDQRRPVFTALAKHGDRRPSEVGYDEVAAVKRLLAKVLAPGSTAILIDPIWAHPHALDSIPGRVGIISTLDSHEFQEDRGERLCRPIDGWSVEKIRLCGADAAKVLVWFHPDVRESTRRHQDAFVMEVGEACRRFDIPLVLELLIYPQPGEVEDSLAYAADRPRRVIESVAHFSDEKFGVDVLKLQFPADLRYCEEYAHGELDEVQRDVAYGLAEVRRYANDLHGTTHVPWVLLSGGVVPREFQESLKLAVEAGASGFLAGRSIWLDALDNYPDVTAIEVRLNQRSLPYLKRLTELAQDASSWRGHPRYGGKVALAGRGTDWYRTYGR